MRNCKAREALLEAMLGRYAVDTFFLFEEEEAEDDKVLWYRLLCFLVPDF